MNHSRLAALTMLTTLLALSGCNRGADAERAAADRARDQGENLTPVSHSTNTYSYPEASTVATKDADNTAVNARDRSGDTLTPGDQGASASDRELTRQIRRAITQSDRFSLLAQNIKIITIDGKVTLRGPVNSEQEKQAILAAAQNATGVAGVDDQLEVKAQNQ